MLYASTKRPLFRLVSVLLVVLLLLGAMPFMASAAETTNNEYIELDGSFTGKFDLSSNTTKLFHLENISPGDQWSGTLHVKNSCKAAMDFAFVSVTNDLEDTVLFDALVTEVSHNGQTIYDGAYGFYSADQYMSKFYSLAPGETLAFDIVVTLPADVGNLVMNKSMLSTWTFEARYYEAPYVVRYEDEDGNPLAPEKNDFAPIGDTVVEKAIDIEDYTPDKPSKSIVIKEEGNVITFVYSKVTDIPQTGDEMGRAITICIWLLVISLTAIVLLFYRVKALNRKKRD